MSCFKSVFWVVFCFFCLLGNSFAFDPFSEFPEDSYGSRNDASYEVVPEYDSRSNEGSSSQRSVRSRYVSYNDPEPVADSHQFLHNKLGEDTFITLKFGKFDLSKVSIGDSSFTLEEKSIFVPGFVKLYEYELLSDVKRFSASFGYGADYLYNKRQAQSGSSSSFVYEFSSHSIFPSVFGQLNYLLTPDIKLFGGLSVGYGFHWSQVDRESSSDNSDDETDYERHFSSGMSQGYSFGAQMGRFRAFYYSLDGGDLEYSLERSDLDAPDVGAPKGSVSLDISGFGIGMKF